MTRNVYDKVRSKGNKMCYRDCYISIYIDWALKHLPFSDEDKALLKERNYTSYTISDILFMDYNKYDVLVSFFMPIHHDFNEERIYRRVCTYIPYKHIRVLQFY